MTILCSGLLFWLNLDQETRKTSSLALETQLKQLEKQQAQQQAAAAYKQQLARNQQQIQSIIKFLEQLKLTPESIILEEVFFNPEGTITIKGLTTSSADLERFAKILQKISRKTILISSVKNNGQNSFEYLVPALSAKARKKP